MTKGAGKPHLRFGKGSGKSKGKHAREQLLARIARSTCRACGERGHWKAECPKLGRGSSSSKEATTTVAQVDTDEAMAADHDQGLEVHDELPAGTQSLGEAFVVIQESHACEIKERLRLLAEKTRKFQNQKIPKLHSLRPFHFSRRRRTEPEAPCTPAGHVDPVAEIIPAMTTTTVGSRESRVLAILDTGASRCVMGANLLNRFVRQFGEDIRSKIRVMPSSVRFRFGNNQTLTSQKRLLLPLLASQDTWWLSIEICPWEHTPVVLQKRPSSNLGVLSIPAGTASNCISSTAKFHSVPDPPDCTCLICQTSAITMSAMQVKLPGVSVPFTYAVPSQSHRCNAMPSQSHRCMFPPCKPTCLLSWGQG